MHARTAWDDPGYNRLRCERSAEVVADWLRKRGAPQEFVLGVQVPIMEHEFGRSEEGDLAQAADEPAARLHERAMARLRAGVSRRPASSRPRR